MLVLTRKTDEQILIGDNIKITLVRVRGNSVRIGIEAPRDVRIVRGELESSTGKSEELEFELSDREQAFAHPQARIISGRVKIAPSPQDSATSATHPIEQAAQRQMFVGKLRRAEQAGPSGRPPLADFISAT